MKEYAKYVPMGIFCLTIGKLLIFGATWEGAATALVAGALAAVYEIKNHDKRVKALEERMEIASIAVNNQAKVIEELRNSIGSVRIAQQAKSLQSTTPAASTARIF